MSFQNFIHPVWAREINTELDKECVFAGLTNRKYEGLVKNLGDSVRIKGVARPTIHTGTDKNPSLTSPEQPKTSAVTMNINQVAWFNYGTPDIDAAIADGSIKDVLSVETTRGFAEEIDAYVAGLAVSQEAKKLYASAEAVSTDNVFTVLDNAWKTLMKNNVRPNDEIYAVIPPDFWTILKQKYTLLDTNNSEMIKTGEMASYSKIKLIMSNAVKTTTSGADTIRNIMIFTNRAIAFANPLTFTEALRDPEAFQDICRGYTYYDAKIVRPKELVVANVKY